MRFCLFSATSFFSSSRCSASLAVAVVQSHRTRLRARISGKCLCWPVVQSPNTRLRARISGNCLCWSVVLSDFRLPGIFFLLVDSPAPGLRNVQFTMRSSPAVMRHFSRESCSQMRFDDLFFWCSHHPLSRNQGSEHQILHCQDAALHPPAPLVLPVAPFALCYAVVCFLDYSLPGRLS